MPDTPAGQDGEAYFPKRRWVALRFSASIYPRTFPADTADNDSSAGTAERRPSEVVGSGAEEISAFLGAGVVDVDVEFDTRASSRAISRMTLAASGAAWSFENSSG